MESIAGILPGLLRRLGLETTALGWRAVTEWPAIAGESNARHSRAASFHDGVLTVEVEGSAWMHAFGFSKAEFVRRANEHVGAVVVREVRFVLARGGNRRCT